MNVEYHNCSKFLILILTVCDVIIAIIPNIYLIISGLSESQTGKFRFQKEIKENINVSKKKRFNL